jgi:hypothetical protein
MHLTISSHPSIQAKQSHRLSFKSIIRSASFLAFSLLNKVNVVVGEDYNSRTNANSHSFKIMKDKNKISDPFIHNEFCIIKPENITAFMPQYHLRLSDNKFQQVTSTSLTLLNDTHFIEQDILNSIRSPDKNIPNYIKAILAQELSNAFKDSEIMKFYDQMFSYSYSKLASNKISDTNQKSKNIMLFTQYNTKSYFKVVEVGISIRSLYLSFSPNIKFTTIAALSLFDSSYLQQLLQLGIPVNDNYPKSI